MANAIPFPADQVKIDLDEVEYILTPRINQNRLSFHPFHRIQLPFENTKPSLFSSWKYCKVPILHDYKKKIVWMRKDDLIKNFSDTFLKIENVFRFLPTLFAPLLHQAIHKIFTLSYKNEQRRNFEMGLRKKFSIPKLTLEEVEQMVITANHFSREETANLIKGCTRDLICSGKKSYVLFTEDPRIASGSCKFIYYALSFDTQTRFAVATFHYDEDDSLNAQNEIAMLKKLKSSKGVLQLEEAILAGDQCFLITELYNLGDLHRLFQKPPPNIIMRLNIALQLVDGLRSIHHQNIIHRDIKPLNCFLNFDPTTKKLKVCIGDLGSATDKQNLTILDQRTGCTPFMPPELVAAYDEDSDEMWRAATTSQIDIWALGLVFYSLLAPEFGSEMSFQIGESNKKIKEQIVNLAEEEIEKDLLEIEPRFRPLIRSMLRIDPKERPHADQIKEDLLIIYAEIIQEVRKAKKAGRLEQTP